MAVSKGLTFSAELSDEDMVIGHCDLNMMGIVVDNLIQNAIKYTTEGTVQVRLVRKMMKPQTGPSEERECAVLEVEDTGIGIPSEEKTKIFTRGYRASNATDIQGTGIGLDVVSTTVHLMRGDIDVESEVGKGTKFIVALPLYKPPASDSRKSDTNDVPSPNDNALPDTSGGGPSQEHSDLVGSSAVTASGGSAIQGKATDSKSSSAVGGVDFRALPIVTQPLIGINMPLSRLDNFRADPEWNEIQNMVNAGIIPSGQRIKDYLQTCCKKKELNGEIGAVLNCIADILRIEEERVSVTDPEFKDMLILLESGKSADELTSALNKINFQSQEPKPIAAP